MFVTSYNFETTTSFGAFEREKNRVNLQATFVNRLNIVTRFGDEKLELGILTLWMSSILHMSNDCC